MFELIWKENSCYSRDVVVTWKKNYDESKIQQNINSKKIAIKAEFEQCKN